MSEKMTRRTFAGKGTAALVGLSALGASKVMGANDRIRLGILGVANRGGQLISAFVKHADAEFVALCDVCQSTLAAAKKRLDDKPDTYADFRKVIDRKDVDAIVIATPDHWHAIQTIDACNAGKDVYVEKPTSLTVFEGRQMVVAARRNQRIVQVGTHRRSGKLYADAVELTRSGALGKVTVTRSFHRSNMYPKGIGKAAPSAPPADLDWDLWLGPRPERPYQSTIAPYKFRWWKEYCCQISNNGVHSLDMMRWLMDAKAPTSICSMGGKFAVDDDRTIPDTEEAIFEFPSWLSLFGMYEANGNPTMARGGFVELRGTNGTLYASDQTIEVVPESGGQFQDRGPRMKPVTLQGTDGDLTVQHARNFLDCMRSRKTPNADIEEGHRSTTMSLLTKISLATRLRLEWDGEKEQITNSKEANDMLHYEYRKPWKLG
jgi:predicted dehydrogenase